MKRIPGAGGPQSYYYDKQMKRLVLQFMAIFTDMFVEVGANSTRQNKLIPVPIFYGRPDRVVAAIKSGNTSNRPVSVPCMTAIIRDIQRNERLNVGVGVTQSHVQTPLGGIIPTDTQVIRQTTPMPFEVEFDLHILTSNTEQQWQILEQIFLIFSMPLQIQTSDGLIDTAKITDVSLDRVSLENNYPIGTEQRTDVATLTFKSVLYMAFPIDIKNTLIQQIRMRVGAVSTEDITSNDLASLLDEGNFEYDIVSDAKDTEI